MLQFAHYIELEWELQKCPPLQTHLSLYVSNLEKGDVAILPQPGHNTAETFILHYELNKRRGLLDIDLEEGWGRMNPLFTPQSVPSAMERKQNEQVGHAAKAGLTQAEEGLSSCCFRVLWRAWKHFLGKVTAKGGHWMPSWIIPLPAAVQENKRNLLSNHPSEHPVHRPV